MQTPPAIKYITVKIHNLKTFFCVGETGARFDAHFISGGTFNLSLKKKFSTVSGSSALSCRGVAESSGFFNFFCTKARGTVARSMKITTFRVRSSSVNNLFSSAQLHPDRFDG